jgi:catechol 2,3-dioxygenase-like lactoylglutathione lyase family enzyme
MNLAVTPDRRKRLRPLRLAAAVAAGLMGLSAVAAALGPAIAPLVATARAAEAPALAVSAVGAVGLTVSDMDRAVSFYSRVLSFEKESDLELAGQPYEHLRGLFGVRLRVVRMRLGEERIELTEYLAPRGRPFPDDFRSNDRAFQHVAIVVADMARAYRVLREHGVRHASTGPQRLPDWNPNAGGIEAFYFRDPDGHFLELIAFPAGKGDPRWQRLASADNDILFLGLDHTAIVVSDTEESLRLYRDTLGLRVAGESENWGTEQEHLNNVFGARLRITGLRAEAGPGIEFLEYLAPGDGRPGPADLRANDLLHWQTTLFSPDVAGASRRLRPNLALFVSPGDVIFPGGSSFRRGLLVRDPDGHALRLVER